MLCYCLNLHIIIIIIILLLTVDTTWNHKVVRISDVPKRKFCYGEL